MYPIGQMVPVFPVIMQGQFHFNNNSNKHPHPKKKFSTDEDNKLIELVKKYGCENWQKISLEMPGRNVRQCRERYKNYLDPEVISGPWTEEEDKLLDDLYSQFGPKWKLISSYFPKRTDINVKSRYHVHFRRATKKYKIAKIQLLSKKTENYLIKKMAVKQPKKVNEPKPNDTALEFDFGNDNTTVENDAQEPLDFGQHPSDNIFSDDTFDNFVDTSILGDENMSYADFDQADWF